jgi:uncharacterized membrane protein YeaQ/YmgE (transglycosylase-associated protein family)
MLSLLSSGAFGLMAFLLQWGGRRFSFWELISWMFVGLLAGVIAKILLPGKDPGGCMVTMVIGIVGAVLAGYLAKHVLLIGDENSWGGFFSRLGLGIVGALIILAIYRLIAGRRA